jgi:hypothetical protein
MLLKPSKEPKKSNKITELPTIIINKIIKPMTSKQTIVMKNTKVLIVTKTKLEKKANQL